MVQARVTEQGLLSAYEAVAIEGKATRIASDGLVEARLDAVLEVATTAKSSAVLAAMIHTECQEARPFAAMFLRRRDGGLVLACDHKPEHLTILT